MPSLSSDQAPAGIRISFLAAVGTTRWALPVIWLSSVACLASVARQAPAQDWPQILGPTRNGQAVDSQLSDDWPTQLEARWTFPLGSGYAGPAIIKGRVLVPHRQNAREQLTSLDLATGRPGWVAEWDANYRGGLNPDDGPRCVPAVQDGVAVCYDASGSLTAVDTTTGKLLWKRPLRQEYQAEDGYFGAGSSPLIVDDLVVVCLGGEQAGILAVELGSGRTRWTATAYDASYASPIQIQSGGKTFVLVVTRLNTVLVDPIDGVVYDDVRFGSRGPTVNAATPIAVGKGRYLLTASYGVGATLLRPSGTDLESLFAGSDLLYSQYNTPVFVQNKVLGINGREDVGIASLRAIDIDSQQVLWEQAEFGTAHLLAVGDRVLALTLDGRLRLIDARAKEYRLLAETRLPSGTYRALPALANNRLLVRATQGPSQSQLLMLELP